MTLFVDLELEEQNIRPTTFLLIPSTGVRESSTVVNSLLFYSRVNGESGLNMLINQCWTVLWMGNILLF